MSGAVAAFACVVVAASLATLALVVVLLLHSRRDDQALIAAQAEEFRIERRRLVEAIIARHAGEYVAISRVDQDAAMTRLMADATIGRHPTQDGYVDDETGERMVPAGFDL